MLDDVPGLVEVYATQPLPKVVFAKFHSATEMMSFVRGQKGVKGFTAAKLWASRNKSPQERKQGRAPSKIIRMLIEVGKIQPADIIVDWKALSVSYAVKRCLWLLMPLLKETRFGCQTTQRNSTL